MSARCAIVDTNVVVAALLTQAHQSPVARVLDGMLLARFPFVLSEPLLAEYTTIWPLGGSMALRPRTAPTLRPLTLSGLSRQASTITSAKDALASLSWSVRSFKL